jgi:ASC-1-like (ASCH) protein
MRKNSSRMKPNFSKHVSEPWYSLIKAGVKTAEGRLNKGDFAQMKIGDIVEWFNTEGSKKKSFLTRIVGINHYHSFDAMIRGERLKNTLPLSSIRTIKQGVEEVYYKYYTPEDERKYGIVAIQLEVV